MIYRIFFQPAGAYWCIQFKSFFLWTTVKAEVNKLDEPVTTHQIVKFNPLAEAEAYCADRGIDRAYHRTQTTTYVTAILSGAKTEEQEQDVAAVRPVLTEYSGPAVRSFAP